LIRTRSWITNGQTTRESIDEVVVKPGRLGYCALFKSMAVRGHSQLRKHMAKKVGVGPAPIFTILNQLPGGWTTAIAILQHVAKQDSECEEARLINVWDEVVGLNGSKTTGEQIAEAADMSPSHMLGLITEAAHLQGVNVSKLIKAINLGEVMQAGVKEALKPSGFKDREKILQSAGLYPAPAGTNISVTSTAQAGAQLKQSLAAADGLDEFERDTLESTEFLRGIEGPLTSPAQFAAVLPVKPVPAEPVEPAEP